MLVITGYTRGIIKSQGGMNPLLLYKQFLIPHHESRVYAAFIPFG
ncbi:hypothetical protein BAXH7_01207 [Bacillus amyloliquefaciens XH7]|nr:hypothetical protein LL3_02421 [Bacillus amyloliquefaciens LL3]AEK88349.1 hypothetical protein BAXH7_01207 [Bacillus amyloliquefaciens XH7]